MIRKSIDWLEHELSAESRRVARAGEMRTGTEHYRIIDEEMCRRLSGSCLVGAIPWLEWMIQSPEVVAALDRLRAEKDRRDNKRAIWDFALTASVFAIVAAVVVALIVAAYRGVLG